MRINKFPALDTAASLPSSLLTLEGAVGALKPEKNML